MVLTIFLLLLLGSWIVGILKSDKVKVEAANQPDTESQSPLKQDTKRDYGEPGLRKVAETEELILYADYTNGEIAVEEKSNGKVWYSNPQDRADDKLVIRKSRLESQLVLNYFSTENNTEEAVDSQTGCVKLGGLDYELIEGGIRFLYSFPKLGIQVPVQYLIQEDVFAAEVLTGEIKEYLTEDTMLLSIDVLAFFGAGGLEEEGYLFVPDGSGALIQYNNQKNRFSQYSESVYGKDLLQADSTASAKNEQITMPVFGLKTGEHAILAIISSNESYATITATTSRKTSSYNQVYSTVIYREVGVPSMTYIHNTSQYYETTEPFSQETYRVEYHMLSGDEANYSGMANSYRSWLIENGGLNHSELVEEPYFILNLYGAVSIEQYVMGFKKPVVTALTTYKEVIDIVKELKARGIDKLILNYSGAMQGGLKSQLVDQFATERVLGSKKEFQEMLAYLEQEEVVLFLEHDPVNLYEEGNGYNAKDDGTVAFYDTSKALYEYSLNQNKAIKSTKWNLIKPSLLSGITDMFFASAKKAGLENYSVTGLGSVLYSDYDVEGPVYRQESLSIWQSILAAAKEDFTYVMVEKGNAYCFPYADIIRDIAVEDSGYDMIDESIPFYQMVVRGNIAISSAALNMTVDYHRQYLKGLETGTNMSYTWIAGDVLSLVETDYNDLVSSGFDYWIDTAVEEYVGAKKIMELTAGKAIIGHRKVAEDIFETTYDGGIRVYVNYSDSEYTEGTIVIAARGYAVVSEEGGLE